jgi:pseudouridine-5'-phosphate glycosidase
VVALETSIVAQGLPSPHNLDAAFGCEAAIRKAGAVPATIAVMAGKIRVGLSQAEIRELAAGKSVKVSSRDLGWAAAAGVSGATTVAATIRACQLAGIRCHATGGIGGVHRGHPEDQSADLLELARCRVAVFCAGAKTVLDLALTMERLESLAVPVLGYGTDDLPGFYIRSTGLPVSARVDGPAAAAAAIKATWETGGCGVVVAVPPPTELPDAESFVEQAAAEVDVHGAELTPRLLARIAELSSGSSLPINVELVINNARVAAETAVELSTSG